MLRHYDAIGLLRPACVDPVTGYRSYQAGQLAELNRIIALKDLGFTLAQVREVLDDKLSAAELRGMLRLRRVELQAQIDADRDRLARVEARLVTIETEDEPALDGIVVKSLAPVRVGELTGVAASYRPDAITPVIQPLYCDLWQRLADAGIAAAGPGLAYYEDLDAHARPLLVHAAVPVEVGAEEEHGFRIVDLKPVETAVAVIHRGSMERVMATAQGLARWIDANGYRSAGYAREVTLEWSADPDEWVTELQQPVYRNGG